jgi:hypothetical protein
MPSGPLKFGINFETMKRLYTCQFPCEGRSLNHKAQRTCENLIRD